MRRPEVSVADVSRRIEQLLGVRVAAAEAVAGSVTNRNLSARLGDGRRVLVKVGQREQLRAEAWILERAATAGLRVPTVVAVDHDTDPPLNVLGWLDGEPSADAAVLAAAGRAMRELHRIEVPGYGALELDASGAARGGHETWSAYLAAELSGLEELVDAGLLTSGDRRRVESAVERLRLGDWPGTGVLLHGDLKRLHVLEHRGRPAGLIDWGDPVVGDPRWDLARQSMMGEAASSAFLSGYGWAPDADLERSLAGYRVVWNVSALCYEFRNGGDWFDAYRDGLRDDLDRLEAHPG